MKSLVLKERIYTEAQFRLTILATLGDKGYPKK